MQLALRDPVRHFYHSLGLDDVLSPDELEAGLATLEAELQRVALDAYTATCHAARFADAVRDWDNYPHLARIHAAMDDILTMSLPPPLEQWMTRFLSAPEPPSFEDMRRTLVQVAGAGADPRLQALARFALFEGLRLELVVMARWYPDETFGVGLELQDLDRIAEDQVEQWLAAEPAVPDDTRPFHILVAAAFERLTAESTTLAAALRHVHSDMVEQLRQRAAIEEALADMDTRDALLIRNAVAPALGEQKLTVDHLQKRHRLALGGVTRNALDQRFRRAIKKGKAALRRRRVALLDLLRNPAAAVSAALSR